MIFYHKWEVTLLSKNLNYRLQQLFFSNGVEVDKNYLHSVLILNRLKEMLRTRFFYVKSLVD